jgi:hypothetical protein
MKKGEPRPLLKRLEGIERKRRESIQTKCHPVIFELAQLWKTSAEARNALGQQPAPEDLAKLEARVETQLQDIYRKYSGSNPPQPNRFAAQVIFSEPTLASEVAATGIAEFLHWERHKIPLKKDLLEMERARGDASRRVLLTGLEYEALRCDNQRPKPFKGDVEHSDIFKVLWGLGVEVLTPEELAVFFDEYCPCGRVHSADALKRQRARFVKALSQAID